MGIMGQFKEDFTLADLQKANLYSYHDRVREVIEMADSEFEQERQFVLIKDQLETVEVKLTEYKDGLYILSEFDITQTLFEDWLVTLKRLTKETGQN